jgi:folate-binding protein YgfZ
MYEILTDRSIVEISGTDSLKFLQNLISVDLNQRDYNYTYMLNNQGRYLFDFFIYKISNNKFLIDINRHYSNEFQAKLMIYKLRANIEIKDLSNIYQIIYSSNETKLDNIISAQDPRYNGLGARSVVMNHNLEQSFSDIYKKDKYHFTLPDGYDDLISEKSIIVEYGANELGAVSYDKGCYIGQELISRTKYQGIIRKKIFKIVANQNLTMIKKHSNIIVDNIKIGAFCSGHQNEGIGLINEEIYCEHMNKSIMIDYVNIELIKPQWR